MLKGMFLRGSIRKPTKTRLKYTPKPRFEKRENSYLPPHQNQFRRKACLFLLYSAIGQTKESETSKTQRKGQRRHAACSKRREEPCKCTTRSENTALLA